MKDVQNSQDTRGVPIQKAGVKDIRYPIHVLDRQKQLQPVVANISMFVDLDKSFKGTHMSRFVEILNDHRGEITLHNIEVILRDMIERLQSESAFIELGFPYFVEKESPVSKRKSFMDYDCGLRSSYHRGIGRSDSVLEVRVPVTSLCPCSKEISDWGAHNQRSQVRIQVRCNQLVWLEELIAIGESSGSASLYALLKREDEKFVTEQAYQNPAFVEDIVRAVAVKLARDERIDWFKVESENFESIHNHNAFASIEQVRVAKAGKKTSEFVALTDHSLQQVVNGRAA